MEMGMDMIVHGMGNNGVRMELQKQGVNGHWAQHSIIQKIIVVYAARVNHEVT